MRFQSSGVSRFAVFAVFAALLSACGSPAPKPLGGVSDACTGDPDCRIGLVCNTGVCEPAGTSRGGDACQLTAECADGLYCSEARVCEAAGTGAVDEPCATSADCSAGLVCSDASGELLCASAGTGDLGDACTSELDCLAGLSCGDASGRRVCASGTFVVDGGTRPPDGSVDGGGVEYDAGPPVDAGPGPFPIGGNVTGLSAGSVGVTLNGTETLTVSANGTFTFTTLVDKLSSFAVEVTAQPADLTCTVSGGRGVAAAPVAYIAVDCSAGLPVSTWEPVTPPSEAVTRKFNDVWVADATRVYVVGPVNAVLSWDGTEFAMESLPTLGKTFFSVGGTDRNHVWVGGTSSLMLSYDGTRWTQHTVGTGQSWQDMWFPRGRSASAYPDPAVIPWTPTTIGWAVSTYGRVGRFDGTSWTVETGEAGNYFAIGGFDDSAIYIARNVGRVLSGASGAFTRAWDSGGATVEYHGITVFQSGFDDPLTDTVNESAYDVVAVGKTLADEALILRCHVDSAPAYFEGPTPVITWTNEAPPAGTPALEDVWAASASAIWAVGMGGTVLKYDGTSWTQQTTGTTEVLRAVDGLDAANVWIVGDRGVIMRGR
jgi:hypothetical protein